MNLTKEKIVALWRMRKSIFSNPENEAISGRFDFIKNTFNEMCKHKIRYEGDSVFLDDEQILMADGSAPSTHYFGCKLDEVTAAGAYIGVNNMAECLPKYKELIRQIGCLLGGFDSNSVMHDEYRIISNVITSPNDNGSLISSGQTRHPSSHFADNNYFFNVIDTVTKIENDTFVPSQSRLVLRWPNLTYYNFSENEVDEKAIPLQRETLDKRFPYKFFYMWAKSSECIHLVSLQSYRNLVQQRDALIQYKRDFNMDESFEEFSGEKGWRMYSKAIMDFIPEEERGDNFIEELSRLLSIVLTINQNVKDYSELLETGSKALILWGPPGTGKTYSAQQLIINKFKIAPEELDNYAFEKGSKNDKGQWALVQFHPGYSYEDFIGGIAPKLDGNSLQYVLKEGVFKRFCDEAQKHVAEKEKKFIFIIDEINRADLSSVFGELMYALEYRGSSIMLPNFPKPFTIPDNVYLIGTMNSVDKSLATFDLALRRRFSFYKVMPNIKVLETILVKCNIQEDNLQDYIRRCERLNRHIADPQGHFRLGTDYQIGHAYFAKIKDFITYSTDENQDLIGIINSFSLEKIWVYHLQPLLEEYLGSRADDSEIQQMLKKEEEQFTAEI